MIPRAICWAALTVATVSADTGVEAWLRYAPLDGEAAAGARRLLPAVVVTAGASPILESAREELLRGVRAMLGRRLRVAAAPVRESAIFLGTPAELRAAGVAAQLPELGPEAFCLRSVRAGGLRHIAIAGGSDRGVLYGAFALLRRLALGRPLDPLDVTEAPAAPVRWVNQWDNLDGTIERGYGGRSIFFDHEAVREDLGRVRDYARLLASLGINGCAPNSVNANPRVLEPDFLPQMARIADVMRPWGVRMVLSVDFGSPKRVGGLDTFDPLDPRVQAWWKAKVDEIYRAVPDLAGLLMKADSEGRVGPSAYGRTHADAANTVARALAPHGGLMFYRAFVYDHHLDWRNVKNDRARAAYDNFHPLDGQFDDNVVIQIKNGPIDFQVREPVSPLFGGLEKTNQAIELQITQEYFGQARHLVCLIPMWKETLDTDLYAHGPGTPVKALISGKVFHRPTGGYVGVANVGLDANWLGNHFSQANLYGFGRLAWNPDLTAAAIVEEWTRLTFGHNPKVVSTIAALQMESWRVYEDYTGPLGLQTLTAITGTHFGPAVEASERNGWGQWHRADSKGVGMDRTAATGTGFLAQYRAPVARRYESAAVCPDDLLLFMHHVSYPHVLHSGKTVIQTIYDTHYAGAAAAAAYVDRWKTLAGLVDQQRYGEVLAQLCFQAGHAEEWRDAVVTWFLRTSGIPDRQGRAGHFPGRVEGESMQLAGYAAQPVTPWEAASGSQAITCAAAPCSASFRFEGAPGWYTLAVRYFDQNDGVSHFRLTVAGQWMDEWAANDHLPSRHVDSASSTLRAIRGVALRAGDEVRIEGTPDGGESAAIDYVELRAERQ